MSAAIGTPGPRVGVVVLQWNRHALTQRCLDSLAPALPKDARLYLADNGSTDGSCEWLAEHAAACGATFVANGTNLGYAAGLAPALERALADGCEWLLLLNNDVVCTTADFLMHGLRAGHAEPSCGLVGGKLVYWPETTKLWSAGGEIRWWNERFIGLGEQDQGQHNGAAERSFVSGACMLVRRAVFKRIGLLSDAYFFGGEDREFCLRARRAGFRILYEPRFTAAHEAGGSRSSERPEALYLETLSRILFRKRNFSPWSYAVWQLAYRAYLRCLMPLRHALAPHAFVAGLSATELRRVLADALCDSAHIERTTLAQLEAYRARCAAGDQRSRRQ